MKTKHFAFGGAMALVLFGCGLQPAFTQTSSDVRDAEVAVELIDLKSGAKVTMLCAPLYTKPKAQQSAPAITATIKTAR